jgi:hypothetical protein
MIAAIVAPDGFLSIAITRACLVSGPAVGLDDAVGRLRAARLADFRAVDRATALGLDFGLVMESSEICATPSAAPPQPRPDKAPGGAGNQSGPKPPKSPQQRSVQARIPVNSEQDCCWLGRECDGHS